MKTSKLVKFASASSVVAIIVAPLAALFVLSDVLDPRDHIVLVSLWCVLPGVWGLWAMFIPQNWLPDRLPHWGALLGLILGIWVIFILDLPSRIFGLDMSVAVQCMSTIIVVAVYFLFWMLVKKAFLALAKT